MIKSLDRSPWVFPREAICPRDKKSLGRYEQYVPYYAVKHAIALEVNPSSILEIGVRAGYSAFAFLSACPNARYVGLDAENGKHGGAGGPWLPWARQLLRDFNCVFQVADTQKMKALPLELGDFDMIHVDGDHTYAGALHDMMMCWDAVRPSGLMLIDDYHYLAPVRKAINAFAYRIVTRGNGRFTLRDSLRGEALFWKSGARKW